MCGNSNWVDHYINAGNCDSWIYSLDSLADDLSNKALDVNSAIQALEEAKEANGVSAEIKTSAEENIALAQTFSSQTRLEMFKNIADYETDNLTYNAGFILNYDATKTFTKNTVQDFINAKVEKEYDFNDSEKLRIKRGETELFRDKQVKKLSGNTEYLQFYNELHDAFGSYDNENRNESSMPRNMKQRMLLHRMPLKAMPLPANA